MFGRVFPILRVIYGYCWDWNSIGTFKLLPPFTYLLYQQSMKISLWENISNIGLDKTIDVREGIKIRLLNQLAVVTGITNIVLLSMGLFISVSIEALIGRIIWVETNNGMGSTFILQLPLTQN